MVKGVQQADMVKAKATKNTKDKDIKGKAKGTKAKDIKGKGTRDKATKEEAKDTKDTKDKGTREEAKGTRDKGTREARVTNGEMLITKRQRDTIRKTNTRISMNSNGLANTAAQVLWQETEW